jgi:hypothetical protein
MLLIAIVSASPANALRSPAGGSSEATVRIQLSVAPRLKLSAVDPAGTRTWAGYCISSNMLRPGLPVRLSWPAIERPTGQPDPGPLPVPAHQAEIAWCDGTSPAAQPPIGLPTTGVALISAE